MEILGNVTGRKRMIEIKYLKIEFKHNLINRDFK